MMRKLSEIEIRGLHGRLDLKIPIIDNRVVLVGINGLGKTTVVNILFFFLTQQWQRLLDFRFEEVSIKLGKDHLCVAYKDLQLSNDDLDRLLREFPPSIRRRASGDPTFVQKLLSRQYSLLQEEWQIPAEYLHSRVERALSRWQLLLLEGEYADSLSKIGEKIEKAIDAQILYLPTYRRIEQDLRALFPHFEEDMDPHMHWRMRNSQRQQSSAGYLELVQFGMEDVQEKIDDTLNKLKERMRLQLSNLTGSYLRDIIREQAATYERTKIQELDDDLVAKILDRVEERTLSGQDKKNLQDVIKKIKAEANPEETEREKYLAHFFSKLVDIYHSQQKAEASLREFVEVCNRYLERKSIIYDDIQYGLKIETEDSLEVEMGQLSSGEKQIVSLLSHVYLGDAKSYFIIIDEPELSLSVEWQKRLLPDLVRSKRCEFIAAVTHSPFIFDNEFEAYAKDLRECIVAR